MQKHDKLSFREEIKTYVRLAMNSVETKTLEDVVEILKKIYLMDIRLKGNTISYKLPYHANKSGRIQAVRGSRLGNRFTVAGIRQYMQEKEQKQVEYRRTMQEVEEAKQYFDDYEEWQEEPEKRLKRVTGIFQFTKPLTAFRQIMMYLKMMKKFFTEVFFRSSMNSGRGKEKLFQRGKQKLSDRKK